MKGYLINRPRGRIFCENIIWFPIQSPENCVLILLSEEIAFFVEVTLKNVLKNMLRFVLTAEILYSTVLNQSIAH